MHKHFFRKGSKPASIRRAQRDVRDAYLAICNIAPPLVPALVHGVYVQELGTAAEHIFKATPTYDISVRSAVSAYVGVGKGLAQMKIYSMNLTVPVADLDKFPDLDDKTKAALRAKGQDEILFMAKEI